MRARGCASIPGAIVRPMPRLDTDIIAVVPRLRVWAQGHANIRRVWLYGSRVRGTQRPDSDLDVAVEIDAVDEAAATLE
jgi:hypothetical protein